ncbi:pyridoxal-dependent decarboxylase, exosortase A system-associated [Nocardioides sp.]|uniref:pyridoxal-dependent decarboxylase, exosortase A system-associated n=1 Tax=Nocardioides sp. TaxID=35761 RepID=UPI0026139FF6|nr:pyridoxal-dependent decarboxylase, exosortase A system-associated [Nocardioides sp.]MCW2739246.1 diaminopimelate decarboxylase [Nocardioides sp.]
MPGVVSDGPDLLVGGVPVRRLADRVGSTPFFAYDRSRLTERVALLRATLPTDLELSYAIKANPMPAVVQHLSGIVDSLDVASGAEMRLALDTPIDPEAVSFAGPGKSEAELSQAIAAGVVIEIESRLEAERITKEAEQVGIRPVVAVRVNPDFEVKGSGMRMGGGPQQFGVDAEDVPDLIRELEARDLDLRGFHVFAGSQNLHAEILIEAQRKTVDLVMRMAEVMSTVPSYLNLGGGFGIPYYGKDQPLDLAAIGGNLHELVRERLRPAFPDARVLLELGRFIVGEAGVYVTRVVDRKVSRGTTFLVVDGGMHHQLAASGNFGQVIRRNYPIAVATRMDQQPSETVQVVGCLCTPLDLLGDKVDLPPSDVGDLVVLFQAGAYGLTASPTQFLSHAAPLEVLV